MVIANGHVGMPLYVCLFVCVFICIFCKNARLLQSEMQKDYEDRQKKQRSRGKKFGIFILRLIVAVLVAAVIAATGLFLYLLITDFIPKVNILMGRLSSGE